MAIAGQELVGRVDIEHVMHSSYKFASEKRRINISDTKMHLPKAKYSWTKEAPSMKEVTLRMKSKT